MAWLSAMGRLAGLLCIGAAVNGQGKELKGPVSHSP